MTEPKTERRAFSVHPSILLTIIREQGGSFGKALAELVMNSIDAGATRIDIHTTPGGFVIADNGRGFSSREHIESSFELFGTPHVEGDAYYGRFRVGRGQIMNYANTTWRSGRFEMRVAIAGDEDLGYDLIEHETEQQGCRIEGVYIPQEWEKISLSTIGNMIAYVPVPVFLDGKQCNQTPTQEEWTGEDDNAWYRIEKGSHGLHVFNKGVWVTHESHGRYGISGVVVTKQSLRLNMARNVVIHRSCQVWNEIERVLRREYSSKLRRSRELSMADACVFINELLGGGNYENADAIKRARFIPDIFGERHAIADFVRARNFTFYDGTHRMLAEAVHREGKAFVIVPEWSNMLCLHSAHANTGIATQAVTRLCNIYGQRKFTFTDFSVYVDRVQLLNKVLPDRDLDVRELVVLKVLRYVASRSRWRITDLRAGRSDTALGWTDGKTFIAIDVGMLTLVDKSGPTHLLALIFHELNHFRLTMEDHDHDFGFYKRFHDSVFSGDFATATMTFIRRYARVLNKLGMMPPHFMSRHVRSLAPLAASMRRKTTRSEVPQSGGKRLRYVLPDAKVSLLRVPDKDGKMQASPALFKRPAVPHGRRHDGIGDMVTNGDYTPPYMRGAGVPEEDGFEWVGSDSAE